MPPPIPATAAEAFPDLPSSAARQQLKSTAAGLRNRGDMPASTPIRTHAQLSAVLPKTVAGLAPHPTVIEGPKLAGDKPVAVTARHYGTNERDVYLKITDTAHAAFMREAVLARVAEVGGPAEGYAHARWVRGHPAIAKYFPKHGSSQLTVLVDNRYLVDVHVTGATSASEAEQVFLSLPLETLK